MAWQDKSSLCSGGVFFRGRLHPVPGELGHLAKQGVKLTLLDNGPDSWRGIVEHPDWGKAEIGSMKGLPLPPRIMIDWDMSLTDDEKQQLHAIGSAIVVKMDGKRGNVLKDRKVLLRFLNALMGSNGVATVDAVANRFWSREALAEELAHDADLDVDHLMTLHWVAPDDDDPEHSRAWLHSHGLAEIGFVDFDVIAPGDDLRLTDDITRAIAFFIVEGGAKLGGNWALAEPGGHVRLVSASRFVRKAPPEAIAIRQADEPHNRNRYVVCDPAKGVLGRWFGRVRPSRFLSDPPDECVFQFSTPASDLMAERAAKTYGRFRDILAELAELGLPSLVKLGYVVDGGGGDEKEHLWFEVHEAKGESVDATLINQPFDIERLREGQRGWHDISLLSDWTIMTSIGNITPRNTRSLRMLRSHIDEFRQSKREAAETA